ADGRIYASGGLHNDGAGNFTFATSVYAFSPSQGQWAAVADMMSGRFFHATVAGPDGRVYVFGGAGSGGGLASCEAYTPATNTWVPCAALGTGREYIGGSLGSDGRIYAVGGYTGSAVGTVEAYGPSIAMAPTSGQAGASIAFSGSNFAANASVSVRLAVPTGQLLGTGVTDSSGALVAPINFKIPAVAPATYKVFAADDRSQYVVNATLTVTP
ncbi:MAG: kelch repeat-containing protein, partial [Polyangia bacterium]